MKFLWPPMLWLLALVPVMIGAYALVLRRRSSEMRRYASLRMVGEALQDKRAWHRHLPAALFLAGIAMALLASARPEAVLTLPTQEETVILAIDVSGSMLAMDMYPDRLGVAQAAAKGFVAGKADSTRVGIVEFAGTALLVHGPTATGDDLVSAIDAMEVRDSTAIGSAIVASLSAIAPRVASRKRAAPGEIEKSAAIILLTDGENTVGLEPLEAARLAAQLGIRIFTVGLGTDEGDMLPTGPFLERVSLDEDSLREIARITGGEYFRADGLVELHRVYQTLGSELLMASRRAELTWPLSAAAALMLILGALLSLLWSSRIF